LTGLVLVAGLRLLQWDLGQLMLDFLGLVPLWLALALGLSLCLSV
jgi:hypothetical protein